MKTLHAVSSSTLLALVLASSTPIIQVASAASSPVLPTQIKCTATPQQRPSVIELSCPTGNLYFDQIVWKKWSVTATGQGRFMDSPCGASVATSQGSVGLVASLPRLIGGKTVFTRLVATQASKKLNVVLTWSGSLDAKGSYLTTNGSLLKVPANNCP